jgi:hypothetical protein
MMYKTNHIKPLISLVILSCILILSSLNPAYAKYVPPEDPAQTAMKFIKTLGDNDYHRAYLLMTTHSRKVMLRYAINRFQDLDDKLYSTLEMDHLFQTNAGGHRTVVFEELIGRYCKKWGVKPSQLTKVYTKLIKMEGPEQAVIRVTVTNKSKQLIMKKEAGEWKTAWYP